MPESVTAAFYTERGVDPQTAEIYARQHNAGVNRRTDAVAEAPAPTHTRLAPPTPSPTPTTAPTDAQRAQAEIDEIRGRRMRGEISDWDWKREYEGKVLKLAGVASAIETREHGTPGDKAALASLDEPNSVQDAFERSIDVEAPARNVSEYNFPISENPDEQERALHLSGREAVLALGFPREKGNHFAQAVNATAGELYALRDDPQAMVARIDENNAAVERTFTRAQIDTVRAFLGEGMVRSPTVRWWVENHPELWETPASIRYLLDVAQSQQRRKGRAA